MYIERKMVFLVILKYWYQPMLRACTGDIDFVAPLKKRLNKIIKNV